MEQRYKMKEIQMATGISAGTLQGRRKRCGIPANRAGYTLSEVKQIIKKRSRQRYSKRRAEELRQILKNDGAI